MRLSTLHQDEHIVVINKAPGMLAQADRTGDPDVVSLLKAQFAEESGRQPFVGLVHRLDRPASGLMVLGRTRAAAEHLNAQFRERSVDKRYLCIVEGRLERIGRWTDYLVKEGRSAQVVDPDHPGAKHAELSWQALAQADGRTLLQVQLHTGRSHQVRIQCASRGCPIQGDFRYGAARELDGQNLALHSYRLAFEHPATHRVARFTAPPPPAWRQALAPNLETAIERVQAN